MKWPIPWHYLFNWANILLFLYIRVSISTSHSLYHKEKELFEGDWKRYYLVHVWTIVYPQGIASSNAYTLTILQQCISIRSRRLAMQINIYYSMISIIYTRIAMIIEEISESYFIENLTDHKFILQEYIRLLQDISSCPSITTHTASFTIIRTLCFYIRRQLCSYYNCTSCKSLLLNYHRLSLYWVFNINIILAKINK